MKVNLDVFQRLMVDFEHQMSNGGLSAEQRFQIFEDFDPFENIPPALLNAGHIASYAMAAGMIEPFEISQLTKPATYLVKVEGECRYRDEEGKLVSFYLSRDRQHHNRFLDVRTNVRLAPNSVCYLTLAPTFRMPSYIGARFNLLIRDVYRGLLVGTGPLVDPGFNGRLSIPIHNFTDREYFIDAGEGLVYFEFTKMTWCNPPESKEKLEWLPDPINDQPPFPASKTNRKSLDDYLNAATGSGPPASSIGQTMNDMSKLVESSKRLLNIYSVGGVIAVAALVYAAWSLYLGAQQFTASAQAELRENQKDLKAELDKLKRPQ
jgi:deoxycytidine triphosphate deaminase